MEFAAEIARGVGGFVNVLAAAHVVGQFHDVVEAVLGAADVEDVELALVAAGNRLEPLDAGELALEGPVVIESAAADDLHRAPSAEDVAGEPDFAVAALADAADERVIGNRKRGDVTGAADGGVAIAMASRMRAMDRVQAWIRVWCRRWICA